MENSATAFQFKGFPKHSSLGAPVELKRNKILKSSLFHRLRVLQEGITVLASRITFFFLVW